MNIQIFQDTKEEYCRQLAQWFDDIKFAGIAVTGQEVDKSAKSSQIFVMPDVVEEIKTSHKQIDSQTDIDLSVPNELSSKRQLELIRQQRQLAQLENQTGKKFSAQQLLSETSSRKLVLLGAPGSGKTTLMSYFAVMLAQDKQEKLGLKEGTDLLPILVKVRDFARQENSSILEYVNQFTQRNLLRKQLPPNFFKHWLKNGQALILLDGLDEVADSLKRYEVVRQIEEFLGQFPQNQAIITSRPAGYRRDFFHTEDFPHYQLQPFDDPKIEEFIKRWYDSRIVDSLEAQRRKDSLKKALSDNDRIKLLATNPLLLTIIALIHRYEAILPKERHKLYEKAVETLLTSWDSNKEFTNHLVFKYLSLDDLRRLLESLAYWIHTQGNTGDKEGGTLIDRDELIYQLTRHIETLKQIASDEAKEEAERFVKFIRERTGLLNEQGQDCYAFVHKTFQEYLCSQEIIYQRYNEDDFGIILKHIKGHLHDAHWREVLLLLIAQQKPKPAAKAIQAILKQHSEYEEWLHRDLFFAGNCLAENPKDLKVADNQLADEILQALVELEISDSPQISSKIKSQVFQTLCSLNETAFETQTLQLLKDKKEQIERVRFQEYRTALGEREATIPCLLKLIDNSDFSVRSSAVDVLSKLGSEAAIPGLLKLIENQDLSVSSSAADALGKIGSEIAIPGLIKLIKNSEFYLSYIAGDTLGKIGSKTAIPGLIKLIKYPDSSVRSSTADTLGKIGSETAIPGLIKLIEDPDSSVRSSAADALGRIGSEAAIPGLIKLIEDPDSSVRSRAADALGQIGSEAVIPELIKLIQDPNYSVRSSAADALGQIGLEAAIPGLMKLIEDPDSSVRYSAADALGKIGLEAVIPSLIKLTQDPDSSVRSRAADALGKIGSEAAIPGLIKLIEDPNSSVRSSAANAFGQIGSEAVIPGLIKLIEDPNSSVRSSAANAFGQIGSEAAIPGLIKLTQDPDSFVRSRAADAFGQIALEAVIPGLIKLIEDPDTSVRFDAANALGKIGLEVAIPELIKLTQNPDYSMRSSAADALGQIGSEAAIPGLIKLIEDPNYYVRSNAVDALGKIASEAVIQDLIKLIEDPNSSVRSSATDALGKIGKKTSSLVTTLAQWIKEHQNSKYVGNGIDLLWDLVCG
ncbi:histidine kinase [Nostoc sp. ATCC 43529]|nr:histidine kinase [Nostoc sp. ATCC 43529]